MASQGWPLQLKLSHFERYWIPYIEPWRPCAFGSSFLARGTIAACSLAIGMQAAKIGLCPILMTSFAILLGVLPLVFATGAGSVSRNSVGTTVFGGMIVSTVLNLFFIPVLYMIVKSIPERNQPAMESTPQT